MTPPTPTDPLPASSAPGALGAFLRGVERRGLVFARLLSGSGQAGDDALAWALAGFRGEAARTAFGEWPRRFWSLLLAAPPLRAPSAASAWEPEFEWLSRIGHGPRAALLLRLVAGLAESDAAGVLGVARTTYRLGLQRALPHRHGEADVEAWEALGRAAQDMVRALPQPVPAAGEVRLPGRARPREPDAGPPMGRGVRIGLAAVAVLTVLAIGWTFLPGGRLPPGLAEAPDAVLSEPLPDAEPPAGRYSAEDALALHPDLGLLLDQGNADAAAADPAFHAWLVAEGEAAAVPEASPGGADPAGAYQAVPDPAVADAAAIATLARADAASALPPQRRLASLDATARDRLVGRRDAWDALPHAVRGMHRERWLAWRALPPAERAALRASALRHAALAPADRVALRARFDDLDESVRRGWLLGPDLGADYARLHPLVAQVPVDARPVLLDALRGLDAQARDDLSVLAARTPPQDRADLRVELLATPAGQRGRWLRTRVSPPQR